MAEGKDYANLVQRVTEYITAGGRPEYQNATEQPKTYTRYNQPLNPDLYYPVSDGSYTKNLYRVAGISMDNKTGKITVTVPDVWQNDEYISSYTNTDLLNNMAKAYKADKNATYQDPFDETKKITVEGYVERLNEALKERVGSLQALPDAQLYLLERFGDNEKRANIIKGMKAEDIVSMSATGGDKDKYIAIPEWMVKAYPSITKLGSYSNGYAKAGDFRDNFFNTTNGSITENQAVAIKETARRMLEEGDQFSEDEDKEPNEFAKSYAFYSYITGETPILSQGTQFAIGLDVAETSFQKGLASAFSTTLDIFSYISTLGQAEGTNELFGEWDQATGTYKQAEWVKGIADAADLSDEAYAEDLAKYNSIMDVTGISEFNYSLGYTAETLAETLLTQFALQNVTEKATTAVLSRGAKTTADTIAQGVADQTLRSSATGLAGQADQALFQTERVMAGEQLRAATKTATSLTGKTAAFFNMTLSGAMNVFSKLYDGTQILLTTLNATQLTNIVNSAVKVAKATSAVNSAMGVLSALIITGVVSNKESFYKVMSGDATESETKNYINQVVLDMGKMALFSATTELVGQGLDWFAGTKAGQKVQSVASAVNERWSRATTKFTSKITSPYLKFRDWWISKKMAKPNVSNATVSASEAVNEAILRNEIRKYGADLGVVGEANYDPSISMASQSLSQTLIGIDPLTGKMSPYKSWKADSVAAENMLTSWGDIEAAEYQMLAQFSDPNIEPVISQHFSEANDIDKKLLKLESAEGLLSKYDIKVNKKLGKERYNFAFTGHSKEVVVYANRSFDMQHADDRVKAGTLSKDSSEYTQIKENYDSARENVSPMIATVIDFEYLPSLQRLTSQVMHRIVNDWGLFPRSFVESLRTSGAWGENGSHYLRRVARKDMAKGTYMPFSHNVERANLMGFHSDKVMAEDDITWIGLGVHDLIREAAIAKAGKKFLKVTEKASGITPEIVMSESQTAGARTAKEFKSDILSTANSAIDTAAEDLTTTEVVYNKYQRETAEFKEQKTNELGAINTADIDALRDTMSENKMPVTTGIVDENTFQHYYDNSNKQAQKLIDGKLTTLPKAIIAYHGSPVTGIEDFDINLAGRNTQSGERAIFFTNDLATAEEFSYEIIPTDSIFFNKRGAKGEVYERALNIEKPLDLRKLTNKQIYELYDYIDPRIEQLTDRDKFIKNIKEFKKAGNDQAIKTLLDLNKLANSEYDAVIARMYPNEKGKEDVLEYAVFDASKISKSTQYGLYQELAASNPLEFEKFNEQLDRVNASSNEGVRKSELIQSDAKAYSELTNALFADNIYQTETLQLEYKATKGEKGSTENELKYQIDEELLDKELDLAIDNIIGITLNDQRALAAIDGAINLSGNTVSDERRALVVLGELLSNANAPKLKKKIKNISKIIVDGVVPKDKPALPGNLQSIYKKVEARLTDKFESALANAKTTLESRGETVESETITELLEKYQQDIQGFKDDPVVVKAIGEDGEIVYKRVSPAIAKIYNNRPVYKPMSTPMQILANMALFKRISLTNLNPRSFAKQSVTDPLTAFATAGAIPGTFGSMSDELKFAFGERIAEQIKALEPYRWQNIVDLSNIENISIGEATIRNIEATSATQLPFTTMSREALSQADAQRYGIKDINKQRKTVHQKLNASLKSVSEKLGKPNDVRETYVRKLAGQKAFDKAIKEGYNYQQAEDFRQWAVDNATTNFRQKHTMFNNLRTATPYLTSAMSGAKSFWKMFEMDPLGVTTRIFNGFVLPVVFLVGDIMNDEELKKKYESIAEYTKENHIPIAVGGEIILIPVGEELGGIVNPIRHLVENLNGSDRYSFWSLMLNDAVSLLPVDLTGFTDIDMWNDISGVTPSFGEVVESGISKLLAQTQPPIAQSVYMATHGRDLYTGNKINTGYVSIDDDGNASIMSYSNSEFAKAVANLVGGDARVIEKVTSGLIGTTAIHVLDSVTSAVQYTATGGREGSLTTAVDKAIQDITAPFATNDYDSLEKRFSSKLSELWDMKDQIVASEEYQSRNKKIAQTKDSVSRQKQINERNGMLVNFYDQIEGLVKNYKKLGGSLDRNKFSKVISLMTFEDALRADKAYAQLNVTYSDAYKQAMQTLYDMGVHNPDGPSMLGYIYTDANGNTQVKMWTPTQAQLIQNALNYSYGSGQGSIHATAIEAIIDDGTPNSLKKQRSAEYEAEQPYWDKYNTTGKLSDAEWDKIDELRKEYNEKVVEALSDYVDTYGAENVLNNDAVIQYLSDIIKVPSSYETIKGRYVSSGNGKLDKQAGFVESYIKTIFGVK